MKRINFFLTVFVAAFSILGSADTNTVLIKYFEKVYSEEKVWDSCFKLYGHLEKYRTLPELDDRCGTPSFSST